MNLIIHEEARFDCPAERLWPFLLEQNCWKTGVVLEHQEGPHGLRGEVLAAYLPGASEPSYGVEAVEVRAPLRLTFRLFEREGGALIGFAAWALRETDGETILNYDVYGVYAASPNSRQAPDLNARMALEDDSARALSRRFAVEFKALRALVENAGRVIGAPGGGNPPVSGDLS